MGSLITISPVSNILSGPGQHFYPDLPCHQAGMGFSYHQLACMCSCWYSHTILATLEQLVLGTVWRHTRILVIRLTSSLLVLNHTTSVLVLNHTSSLRRNDNPGVLNTCSYCDP